MSSPAKIILQTGTDNAAPPAAGRLTIYAKTDNLLYIVDSLGNVNVLAGFSGSFADLVGTPITLAGYGITDANPAYTGDVTKAIDGTVLTLSSVGTPGTYTSVTTDAKGRVTAGTNPTTLTGYGITDAVNVSALGANSGVATLDAGGKITATQLPSITVSDTFVVATEVAMLALAADVGDVAVRTDLSKSFILKTADASILANWQELLTPADVVQSVNGQTGTVTLDLFDGAYDSLTGAPDLALKANIDAPTFTTSITTPIINFSTGTAGTIDGFNFYNTLGTYYFGDTGGAPVGEIYGTWKGVAVDIANGGTGATDAASALTNLLPTQTGNATKVLTTNGTVAAWGAGFDGTFAALTSKPTTIAGYGITDANPAYTGDVTKAVDDTVTTLANTAVTPGAYTAANITVDSKGRITAAANGTTGGKTKVEFTATGAATWTVPAGVTSIDILVVGGGGGGGPSVQAASTGGGGGGGGGVIFISGISTMNAPTLYLNVGTGGVGDGAGTGGSSSIEVNSAGSGIYLALAGGGGYAAAGNGSGQPGTAASPTVPGFAQAGAGAGGGGGGAGGSGGAGGGSAGGTTGVGRGGGGGCYPNAGATGATSGNGGRSHITGYGGGGGGSYAPSAGRSDGGGQGGISYFSAVAAAAPASTAGGNGGDSYGRGGTGGAANTVGGNAAANTGGGGGGAGNAPTVNRNGGTGGSGYIAIWY